MATSTFSTSQPHSDKSASMPTLLEQLTGSHVGESVASNCAPARAIAWARVSTAEQDERGLSIPEQLREIRQYAKSRGIEIVSEFTEAVSAYQHRAKRAEFERMIKSARAERVPMILVHDFSRFSRDSVGAKALVRELRGAGIKVVSLNDPEIDPETVAGVYMEAITFAKNEAYSREVAFHTRKGCRANVQTRDPETGWSYKNGGQPPWGYRALRVERGQDKRSRPIIKSVWTLDDTIIAGRPAHEWAHHCLVELAAAGASLAELRDFCNRTGIPTRRKRYWGISTWNAILQPSAIMQFCGYGVWNAPTKEERERPPSGWVTVPNAHPALITEDEARAIIAAPPRQGDHVNSDEPRPEPDFCLSVERGPFPVWPLQRQHDRISHVQRRILRMWQPAIPSRHGMRAGRLCPTSRRRGRGLPRTW